MKKQHGILWVGVALALGSACSDSDGAPTGAGDAGDAGDAAGTGHDGGNAGSSSGAPGSDSGSPPTDGGGGDRSGDGGEAARGGATLVAGAAGEGADPPPASCVGPFGAACGPAGDDDCCRAPRVPGGRFLREYDGLVAKNDSFPATVSDFALDKYEVTVARFRSFVEAWVAGYRPAPGSGKHQHLAGGGLFNELGWEAIWNEQLPANKEKWDELLACQWNFGMAVWTPETAAHETKPINCVTWYDAYAFCIFDGGFLPTQAESNYAAAGGGEQRLYPWSSPPQATLANPSHAVYGCRADGSPGVLTGNDPCTLDDLPSVGSRSPKGDGRWGQSDLSGSVHEWVLDVRNGSLPPGDCIDCVNLLDASGWRDGRGGTFETTAVNLQVAKAGFGAYEYRSHGSGIRCARSPSTEGSE